MSFIRNLFVAGGVAGTGTLGYVAYNNYLETEKNLKTIQDEADKVLAITDKTLAIFDTAKKIPDQYTSKTHYFTVGSLSLKDGLIAEEFKKELDKAQTSYYAGYLQQTLQENRLDKLVFEYQDNLQVALPAFDGKTHKGFVFAGTLEKVINLKSHEDILNGNYISCDMNIEVRLRDSSDNIIITATTDCNKCSEFARVIIADAAVAASLKCTKTKIDSYNVLSDTPVIDYNDEPEEVFTEVGDLMSMPEFVRKKIVEGDFTACNYFTLRKTRMSNGTYKKLPSIITGTTDPRACSIVSFNAIMDQIKEVKNQNNQ